MCCRNQVRSATFNPLKEVMIHHSNIHVMPWLTHELVIQWWSPTYTKCNRRLGTQKTTKQSEGQQSHCQQVDLDMIWTI